MHRCLRRFFKILDLDSRPIAFAGFSTAYSQLMAFSTAFSDLEASMKRFLNFFHRCEPSDISATRSSLSAPAAVTLYPPLLQPFAHPQPSSHGPFLPSISPLTDAHSGSTVPIPLTSSLRQSPVLSNPDPHPSTQHHFLPKRHNSHPNTHSIPFPQPHLHTQPHPLNPSKAPSKPPLPISPSKASRKISSLRTTTKTRI